MKPQALFILGANTFAIALATTVSSNEGCLALKGLIGEMQQQNEASAACSSLLQPAVTQGGTTNATSTVLVTSTKTNTVIAGSKSTVYTFLSGNPPTSTPQAHAQAHAQALTCEAHNNKTESATMLTAVSSWISRQPSAKLSAICACLGISVGNGTSGNSSAIRTAITQTSTVTQSTTIDLAVSTSSVWPCASPFPTLIPTSPYGDANTPSNFSTVNSLFHIGNSKAGASAQACCNACYFDLPNCVQAYWYGYEGCVVSQATNASVSQFGSGQHVSSVCPAGTFKGLSYTNDTNPAFRSTGNIAGPCGQVYTNL